MEVASTIDELREFVAHARREKKSLGLVPTMGALHAGHLSLVDASRVECDLTAVTIFVNPTQFGPHEDLSAYPRPLASDLAKLRDRDVDIVFAPSESEMYSADHTTFVDVGPIAQVLEGAFRPTHFRGVATIVLKLFHLIPGDRAYFGQKDFQQTLVVKRMVADLNLPIEIRVCATVRESDGLALSSRNAYLSADQRLQALAISRSLHEASQMVAAGERTAASVLVKMRSVLAEAKISLVDYVALVDPETLENRSLLVGPTLAAVAARVGSTRLIDNELLFPND
jgi:pantoate--beta-alanine ligase